MLITEATPKIYVPSLYLDLIIDLKLGLDDSFGGEL